MMKPILAGTAGDELLRIDAATVLKRFFHLERALLIACAGWVPAMHRVESKELLARSVWENSLTADALRERVFEMRFPDRELHVGPDQPLVELFEDSIEAPSPAAFMAGLAEVLLPALKTAYSDYLRATDALSDGPSRRFLATAQLEKQDQQASLTELAAQEAIAAGTPDSSVDGWVAELKAALEELGGVSLSPIRANELRARTSARPFALAEDPGRDERYFPCSFYWPDIVDPEFPYGTGLALQVRTAVSHLNEVWAVDTAGAMLHGFARDLGWEYIRDASRWLYDESRHMMLGARRFEVWGIDRAMVPLGKYIYEACAGEDIIYRLGMLAFFETKNIGKKRDRVETFHEMGDNMSERDMDFDWADEAIHAGYGRRWMRKALEVRGQDPESWPAIVSHCEDLVERRVQRATQEEIDEITKMATALLAEAESRATTGGDG